MLVLLVFSSSAHAENVQEAPQSPADQVEEENVTQPDTAQEESGLSDDFFREMAHWYGPKNYAMHTNKEYFNAAPSEVVQDIFDRWLNMTRDTLIVIRIGTRKIVAI